MKEIRFNKAAFDAECRRKGPEYCGLVASLGRFDGENVWLTEPDLETVRKAFPKRKATVKDSLIVQLWRALRKWAMAGFPFTPARVLLSRHEACRSCRLNIGFGILGGCKKCKCTGAKLILATESCPLNLW